jgi:predicted nucleic acid-binding protein
LVASALVEDPDHESCTAWFRAVDAPLVVPDLVIPEVCYLLAQGAQTQVESGFLRSLVSGRLKVEHVVAADLERAAELVERYADLGLGAVDASVVSVAERLEATDIATLDHRHFRVVRPAHIAAFTLRP